ncbi:hypothetical protein [Frondihabitans sp. 762G35]|uniref:hypothetical protein n=1 Tax=Frondihabitans sp. 762G35 TaxID=1446794 RepID=UPI000F4EE784|nr:hypothetical protein [Frondihabitans sp. 762G35]
MADFLVRALAVGACSIVLAAAGTFATSTGAAATEAVPQPTNQGSASEQMLTELQFAQAMEEARRLGLTGAEHVGDDGVPVRTVSLGDGISFGVSAGLCVVSAGGFCVVAGAILTAAGLAISANNGQRSSGGRQLRVYPFSGHKPRCA